MDDKEKINNLLDDKEVFKQTLKFLKDPALRIVIRSLINKIDTRIAEVLNLAEPEAEKSVILLDDQGNERIYTSESAVEVWHSYQWYVNHDMESNAGEELDTLYELLKAGVFDLGSIPYSEALEFARLVDEIEGN